VEFEMPIRKPDYNDKRWGGSRSPKSGRKRTSATSTANDDRYQVADDIYLTERNHNSLVNLIKDRLEFASGLRNTLYQRFADIDRQISPYMELSADDKRRERDNKSGRATKPVDFKLSLTDMQIEDAVTYLMNIFAPESGMYEAVAKPGMQAIAEAFAELCNKNASRMGTYRHLALAFTNAYKYNLGAAEICWEEIYGNIIQNNAEGQAENLYTAIWAGNKVENVDIYNVLWDPSVHPCDVPANGEFVARVDVLTKFAIEKLNADGTIFGFDDYKDLAAAEMMWWRAAPQLRRDGSIAGTGGDATDWTAYISAGALTPGGLDNKAFEVVKMYLWLDPTKYGLKTRKGRIKNSREIWEVRLLNNAWIVSAKELTNAHGMLPILFTVPNEDGMYMQARSYAEMLIPLNIFASFMLNVHQRAQRKKLYGFMVYDKDVVDLSQVNTDETGRVAGKTTATGKSIKDAIATYNDAPDTTNTMADVSSMIELMQKVLPTDMLKQVASLERATTFQAAATVQAGNRRPQHIAKKIDTQMLFFMRLIQLQNILQYQPALSFTNEQGNEVQIDPKAFRDAELEYTVGSGLKGLDRLMVVEGLKEALNILIQRPDVTRDYDLIGLINYWTSLVGDNVDITQFKYKTPMDGMPTQVKQMAYQMLMQAATKNPQLAQQLGIDPSVMTQVANGQQAQQPPSATQ
jgi:hypothetical protein